jgi:lysophospholipase L1-like esterase
MKSMIWPDTSKKIYCYIVFSVAVLCSLGACKKNTEHTLPRYMPPADTIPPGPLKKMLALGDSYTIGQSVPVTERFPIQTTRLLYNQQIAFSAPLYVATTGWTTGNLLAALNSAPPDSNYDIVTLLIGVNNQFQRRSIVEYRTEFTELLDRAIKYAGNRAGRVFVLSIPDYSVTPFAAGSDTAAIAAEIDTFNEVSQTISTQYNVHYVDITPVSREARTDATLTANDGLHPSARQYARWAELLAPMIRQAL